MNILKKITTRTAICTFALAFAVSSANASTLSLSGPASANIGDTVQFDILGDFNDTGFLLGGTDLTWNSTVLSLSSIVINNPFFSVEPFPGFLVEGGITDPLLSCPGNTNCPAPVAGAAPVRWGAVDNVLDPNYENPFAGIPAELLFATVTFDVIGGGEGTLNLGPDTFAASNPWSYDDGGTIITIADPVYSGAGLTVAGGVIPVPAAVWLFASGLLGLVGVARRRTA